MVSTPCITPLLPSPTRTLPPPSSAGCFAYSERLGGVHGYRREPHNRTHPCKNIPCLFARTGGILTSVLPAPISLVTPCSAAPCRAVGAGLAGGRHGRKHEAGAWNDSSFPEGTWAQCCWLRDLLMQFLLQVRKLKTRGSSPGPRSGQESQGPFPQRWQDEPGRPESRKSCSDPFFFLFSSSFGGQCSNFYFPHGLDVSSSPLRILLSPRGNFSTAIYHSGQ